MDSSSNVSTSISSTYNNVQVPLFEGQNYDYWVVKMETLFKYLDVLEFVNQGYENQQLQQNKQQQKVQN